MCEPRKKMRANRGGSARRCPGELWIHGPSPQTQERQEDPRDAVIERAVARALAEQARREALAAEAALRQDEADRSRAEGSSAAKKAAAHVAAVQRHWRDAQSPRETEAARQDTLSLFEEVKQVISSQLTTDNVTVLASISNTGNGDGTYNLSAIEDAIDAIRLYFDGHNSTEDRHMLYNIYVARMLIENAPQLVEKYNRIVKNVRKFFPGFNLVRAEHNHIFGRLASLSCNVRRCSEKKIEAEQYGRELNPADLQDSDLRYVLEHFDEYYGKQYADDINGKARSLANRHGLVYAHKVFSANLAKMIDYTSYTGSGFSVINDLLRGNNAADLDFMVDRFAAFAHHLALPMYTNNDLVLYRGDGFRTSPPTLTAMGFYSGALSPTDMEYFVRDGGRVISITHLHYFDPRSEGDAHPPGYSG